jgi:hypothetical protein
MKLSSPFFISARLAPAVRIADAVLSFDRGQFVLDLPDGSEHRITDFHFPAGRVHGATDESELQDAFGAILSFLSACAESRAYARRRGRDESEGENSDLFPANVGEWAESVSDELGMLACELEETRGLIAPE